MPIQVHGVLVHAMSGTALSRLRTHPLRILPTVSPHEVQPDSQFPGHGHLGGVPLPPHRHMHIASSPARITTRCGLRCFHQQETQQKATLLGDVSQTLLASARVLRRNQSDIATDLLAPPKSLLSPDDQHAG
jgi:hypothetical protein